MVGAMHAMPPSSTPPAPAPGPSGSDRPAAPAHRFALAVTPESLQQRWRAVLQPEAAPDCAPVSTPDGVPDAAALEFSTPLDLLRHLAQLPALASDPTASPLPRTGSAGLR